MRRPQSPERVFLKTLLVMLVFFEVSKVALSCGNCNFEKTISTSEITISNKTNCAVSLPKVVARSSTSNGNGIVVSDLQPGTSYNLTLNCTTECCIQFTTEPDVIRNLTATQITTSSVSLSWAEPQGSSSFYRVEWADSTVPLNKTTSQTSVKITGLIAGAQYTFVITAVAEDRLSEGGSVSMTLYTRPDVIRNLSVTHVTTDTVSLSWAEPKGNSSFYRVEWADSTAPVNKTTNQTSVSITSLTAGVQYVFTVVAVAADSQTAGGSVDITQYTRPDVIRNLSVTHVTTDTVSLSWAKPEGSSSFYRVQWADSTAPVNKTTNQTSVSITSLTAGVQYVFTVVAVAADSQTAGGSVNTTLYTRPDVIRNLSVTHVTTDTVSLSWAKPEGSSLFYRVEWADSTARVNKTTNQTSVSISSLTAGVQYVFTVVAVAADSQTAGGSVNTTLYTRPEKVVIVVNQTENSSLVISWYHRENATASGYEVQLTNSDLQFSQNESTTAKEATFTELKPGRNYNITVTSVAGSYRNTSDIFTFATKPNPPQSIRTSQTNNSISVAWETPLDMDGLTGISYIISYQDHSERVHINVSEKRFDLYPLSPATQYDITLQTVGPQHLRSTSVNLSEYTAPNPVKGLKAMPQSSTSVMLQWEAPSEDQQLYSYRIHFGDSSEFVVSEVGKVSTNSTIVTGLQPGTMYNFSVTPFIGNNVSGPSETTSGYTKPKSVSNLIAMAVTKTAFNLTWARQDDHKDSYSYLASCEKANERKNKTINNEHAYFDDLSPDTQYHCSVITVVNSVPSIATNTTVHTAPEGPSNVMAIGTTVNMTVTWESSSVGDSYRVTMYNSSDVLVGNRTVPSVQPVLFSNLRPGHLYSVTVFILRGEFQEKSETITNATYPNPPGAIQVEQTNSSINISWDRPLDMDLGQYNFTVSQSSHRYRMSQSSHRYRTANTWFPLQKLESGTQYNISVETMGPLGYLSTPVQILASTRPQSVSQLRAAEINTSGIMLIWNQPDPKEGYQYHVMVAYPNGTLENRTEYRTSVSFVGLRSGSNHTFTVTTLTADGTTGYPQSISLFTRPFPIRSLNAVTQNTSTVYLNWTRPQHYQPGYSYRLETTGCTSAPQNQTGDRESAYVTDLTSGSQCTFTVYSQVENGIEGKSVSLSQYTKPEKLTPAVSPGGRNDSISVAWQSPRGTIEKYTVTLTSSDGSDSVQELDSTARSYMFPDLMAARVYTVKLETRSGPFTEESEPVSNATYPNQPGPITIKEKTTNSISLEWGEAPGMDIGSFNYSVFYQPTANTTVSHSNAANLSDLAPGTAYNIAVSSVGPLGFTSQPVWIQQVTTKPESVRSLRVISTSVEEITLEWEATRYSYKVSIANYTNYTHLPRYQVRNLTPGTQYTISVTTLALDGTEGIQTSVTNCTAAAPVTDLSCWGPNLTDAVLMLNWSKPRGTNQGFTVQPNNHRLKQCNRTCSHSLTQLSYDTEYTVMVLTLSCGESSRAVQKVCRTGITVPPAPNTTDVSVARKDYDRFTLQLSSSLFNNISGRIVGYGVLLTSNPQSLSGESGSSLRNYLNKTYDNWIAGSTTTYLTILKEAENRNRDSGNGPVVVVGDGTKLHPYNNGPLRPFVSYSFAVVTFTYLELNEGFVSIEKSFFSISKVYHEHINLPINPVFIGGAAGGALAALVILIIVTVIAVVYWRRLAQDKSSDVPIYSIRAKVSAPIKVENYEAYYRQHRADSNCGFAELYENLKPVGVTQAKVSAMMPENKGKNRYNNVLPYDSSRVKLSIHGTPHDDYINASYMPGYNSRKEFIAAQGPLPSTVSDFWRMIWEKNVHTLVMLTRCNEQGRVKCEQYWPSETQHYSSMTVTTTSEIPLEDWTIRDFSVKNVKTAETRNIRHFHFTAWPDHGVPETPEVLINFRHLVREHMDQYSCHSPTVVHCSAGVGRTGTFIAIDRLIFQIERDSLVDVYGVVHDLRMHRPLMVQTEDQYVFLNQCALDIIRSRTGTNVDLIYQNMGALSIYENFEPMKSKNGYQNA